MIATGSVGDVVVELDAATGAVVHRARLRGPRIAAVRGGDVWVDTDDGLTRLGPGLAVRARDRPFPTLTSQCTPAGADYVRWEVKVRVQPTW